MRLTMGTIFLTEYFLNKSSVSVVCHAAEGVYCEPNLKEGYITERQGIGHSLLNMVKKYWWARVNEPRIEAGMNINRNLMEAVQDSLLWQMYIIKCMSWCTMVNYWGRPLGILASLWAGSLKSATQRGFWSATATEAPYQWQNMQAITHAQWAQLKSSVCLARACRVYHGLPPGWLFPPAPKPVYTITCNG